MRAPILDRPLLGDHTAELHTGSRVHIVQTHLEYGVCTQPAEHDGGHGHGIIRAQRDGAELMADRIVRHGGCGHLTSRTVAHTAWGTP